MHSNIDLKRYEFILFKQIPMIESAYHLKNFNLCKRYFGLIFPNHFFNIISYQLKCVVQGFNYNYVHPNDIQSLITLNNKSDLWLFYTGNASRSWNCLAHISRRPVSTRTSTEILTITNEKSPLSAGKVQRSNPCCDVNPKTSVKQ